MTDNNMRLRKFDNLITKAINPPLVALVNPQHQTHYHFNIIQIHQHS